MRYPYVLVDADDTLFDYSAAEAFALQRSFQAAGLEYGVDVLRNYRKINAQAWSLLEQGRLTSNELQVWRFARLFDDQAGTPDPAAFSASYLHNLSEAGQLMEGARELLEGLRLAGVQIALVSNGYSAVQRPRLARAGVENAFDAILISEEVGINKPEAGIFDEALRKLGCKDRKQALMVGDSLSADIRGAYGAGLDSCWYNPRGLGREGVQTTYEVNHLIDVLPIVMGERK